MVKEMVIGKRITLMEIYFLKDFLKTILALDYLEGIGIVVNYGK